jgi:hypothetical protein
MAAAIIPILQAANIAIPGIVNLIQIFKHKHGSSVQLKSVGLAAGD